MSFDIALWLAQDGLTNGAIYALLALALLLVFSVTRVIFVPQGDFISFAALSFATLQTGQAPAFIYVPVAAGLMAEAGLEAVWRAQASGVWSALDAAEDLLVPPDLAVAFAAAPAALATFEGFTRGSRKIILTWVYGAKRPETRAARVAQTVALAAQGLRANHPQDLQQLRSTSG